MRKLTKRSTAVVAGVAVAVIGGGAAWAAVTGWSINGSGSADATAASITPLTATSTLAGTIYPGVTTTVNSGVVNPNDFPVQLTASSAGVTSFEGTTDAGCKSALIANPAIFTTTFPGNPVIGPHAAAPGQSISSSVTIGDLPQACAGKAIKINYTFTGVSAA